MNNESSILSLINLNKTFTLPNKQGVQEVLRSVNFQVAPGDFISISGSSGCGKSTLLQLIGGLDVPTSGEILFRNNSILQISERKKAELRRHHLGFIFQAHHLLPDFSSKENLILAAQVTGISKSEAGKRAEAALAQVGLEDKPDHYPSMLSIGQQQRIGLARAIVNRPDIILADEPTGSLDSKTSLEIQELFLKFNQENKQTIILVTHDSSFARKATKEYSLQEGNLIQETPR